MLSDAEIDLLLEIIGQRSASEELLASWREEIFGDNQLTTAEAFTLNAMREEWRQLEREILRHVLSRFTREEQRELYDLHTSDLMLRWLQSMDEVTETDDAKFEALLTVYAEKFLSGRVNPSMFSTSRKVLPS